MTLVGGIDSSTQSVKIAAVCEAKTGVVVRHGSAPRPKGTTCPPQAWWEALLSASVGLLDGVAAIGVAGQQHGMGGLATAPVLGWGTPFGGIRWASAPTHVHLMAEG